MHKNTSIVKTLEKFSTLFHPTGFHSVSALMVEVYLVLASDVNFTIHANKGNNVSVVFSKEVLLSFVSPSCTYSLL